MRHAPLSFGLLATALASLSLAACRQLSPAADGGAHGRYVGIGIYTPGAGWARQTAGQGPATTAARLGDDDAVIVVVDSQTGEVRSCGSLSGYCIGINPWRADLAKPQRAPVDLTAHAKLSIDMPAANEADNAPAPAPSR